ncbi:unnamed protein product, partial [Prorocentrum cordatum]
VLLPSRGEVPACACLGGRPPPRHGLSLTPAWPEGALEFTNAVNGFSGVLDHVFVDDRALTVWSRIPGVPLAEVRGHYGGLPNEVYGSDHLAMACDVEWQPSS